jgi:succinyl-CoA synthetase beta subunit/citryl-CoA synthetase large subunit
MGKVLEDCAKELFREASVAVPAGRPAATAEEAEEIAREIGGPVVVKALVAVGKRGRGGGIRFAATPEDAGKQTADLLDKIIYGLRVRRVLVEARLDIERELYASIGFDSLLRTPLLLLSTTGGVEIEELLFEAPHHLIRVPLEDGLIAHRAREGWRRAGLTGALLVAATECTTRLVSVFSEVEGRLLEVNPLTVTRDGEIVAASAVLVLDENAMARHPELARRVQRESDTEDVGGTRLERRVQEINRDPSPGTVRLTEFPEGVIGSMVSGGGGGLLCLDLMDSLGVRPMNTFDITPGPVERKMYLTARAILSEPRIRGLIVGSNITNFNRVDVKVRAVVEAIEDEGVDPRTFPVVIRLTGPGAEEARTIGRRIPGIWYYEDDLTLEDAIRRIVQLVYGREGAA